MVTRIYLFIEGGGPEFVDIKDLGPGQQIRGRRPNEAHARFKEGFRRFFNSLSGSAENDEWLHIIMGGGYKETWQKFEYLPVDDSEEDGFVFKILLIDSHGAITPDASIKGFLAAQNAYWNLSPFDEDQLHLMVQEMEAWFLCDKDMLLEYFGSGFKKEAIPHVPVESLSTQRPNQVQGALNAALSGIRGRRYIKIADAPELLKRIRIDIVRRNAPFCDLLCRSLEEKLGATP